MSHSVHYPRLRNADMVTLAGGENVWLPATAPADALVEFAVDILQPDITKNCSAAVALDAIALARQKQKFIFPHYLGSAIGQAASIHLASGCSSPFGPVPLVEWDINPNPLRTDLLGPDFVISNGRMRIPNEPGLGWPLDVARFAG
jgi:D-galactarolactone cycloisomerase